MGTYTGTIPYFGNNNNQDLGNSGGGEGPAPETIMNEYCCQLVGNFPINIGGITSVSNKETSEMQLLQHDGQYQPTTGPRLGEVSITAYAAMERYHGCEGDASVSVPWVKKTDCDEYHFIWTGLAEATITGGDNDDMVQFPVIAGTTNPAYHHHIVNASVSTDPTQLYQDTYQETGYGLIYTGLPWSVDTTTEDGCIFNLYELGFAQEVFNTECYLQSLSLQLQPGQFPTVSMNFTYKI